MDIAELLHRMESFGDRTAIASAEGTATFRELGTLMDIWRRRLDEVAMASAGEVVALVGDYSPEACALFLVLVERRSIVVPLSPDSRAHHEEFLSLAMVETVVRLERAAYSVQRTGVRADHLLFEELRKRNSPGLVLFSSGSTGRPKAIVQDLGVMLDRYRAVGKPRVTLTFLLLDHIGGINTLLYALASGGTVVTVRERTPEDVCRTIQEHGVQLLPVSPTFLQLLLVSEAYLEYDLSSLEVISYGTEIMPESTLKRLHAVLPGVNLVQTYGMSEIGILKTRSEGPDSVWVKVGGEGFETKVMNGTLWVKANSAMLGYINAANPLTEDGWLDTEDLVEQRGDYIRFLGRKTDLINVGGQKVYPAEVESVLLTMPEVLEATVHGEPNPITGKIVVACIRPSDDQLSETELRRLVQRYCRGKLPAFKIPAKVLISREEQHNARFKTMRPKSCEG